MHSTAPEWISTSNEHSSFLTTRLYWVILTFESVSLCTVANSLFIENYLAENKLIRTYGIRNKGSINMISHKTASYSSSESAVRSMTMDDVSESKVRSIIGGVRTAQTWFLKALQVITKPHWHWANILLNWSSGRPGPSQASSRNS